MIDLHTHSTRSDGTTTPSETVRMAAEHGLTGIALTDHDTLDGWAEAGEACREHGLQFVPGVELSTEIAGRSVHLLGYYISPDDAALLAECDRLRHERLRRAEAMVAKLGEMGVEITMAEVLDRAAGAPVGRPHIAATLVARGVVEDHDGAFDGYIEDGGPAYVPKHALSPEDGVRLIAAAGGVAVLAHPGISTRDAPVDLDLLDRLTAAGLSGVEADHAAHDPEMRKFWRAAAEMRTLYVTGASDFHGTRKDTGIGEAATPIEVVTALWELSSAASAADTIEETPW